MRLISLFLLAVTFLANIYGETILITGGAGYIGSHVNEKLYRQGHTTIVLDNLSQGFKEAVPHGTLIEGDIADSALLDQIFSTYKIDAVMHFASWLDVGESVHEPLKYYKNNVAGTLGLLEAMLRANVKTIIFSSTAAIFGVPEVTPITEDHPCAPINPYGQTKLTVEKILKDFDRAYGLRYCAFRYFNAAGGDPEGFIKDYKFKDFHLIPFVLRSMRDGGTVSIFGTDYPTPDGTCIRDYIHVEDLASAHIAAMQKLLSGAPSACYNLGSGHGFSVREVIAAVEKVTGQKVSVIEGPRRAGDPPTLVASSEKAQRELGWEPRYIDLEDMVKHCWQAIIR